MNTLFRPLLAAIAVLFSTFPAQAQQAPVTIYGHEYLKTAQMALTVMKPDGLSVDRVRITSGIKAVTVKTHGWSDPAVDSTSEESTIIVALTELDFSAPVVVTLLNGKSVVRTYRLDNRSAYGNDFLDFYTEL